MFIRKLSCWLGSLALAVRAIALANAEDEGRIIPRSGNSK